MFKHVETLWKIFMVGLFVNGLIACRDESIGTLFIQSRLQTWFVLDSGLTGNFQQISDSIFYTVDSMLARNRQTPESIKKITATRVAIRWLSPPSVLQGAVPLDSLSRLQLAAQNGDSLISIAQLDTVLRANISGQELLLIPTQLSFKPLLQPSDSLFFVLKARLKGRTKTHQRLQVSINYQIE